jgi:misacylated tRNA(Ala) deacylase
VLDANPALLETPSVKSPHGGGQGPLGRIGKKVEDIDLQPSGGTHVSRTAEIRSRGSESTEEWAA